MRFAPRPLPFDLSAVRRYAFASPSVICSTRGCGDSATSASSVPIIRGSSPSAGFFEGKSSGSRTPSGTYTYIYNPNIISPLAAGIGAGIGSAIGNAIVQGQIRRANRRSCLMIRGWRLVEVDDAETLKLSAMTDEQRDAFFSTIIGATDLGNRKVTTWTNDFAAPRLAAVAEQ